MKTLRPSTQYKKDLKRIRNNPKKAEALLEVLRMLENEIPIPEELNLIYSSMIMQVVWNAIFKVIFFLFGWMKRRMILIWYVSAHIPNCLARVLNDKC